MPVAGRIYKKDHHHYKQHVFSKIIFQCIFPEIINCAVVQERINNYYNRKKNDTAYVQFMQERKISFCFKKTNHEKHKEPDTETLKHEIHIGFKEKVAVIGTIIIELLGE